VVVVLAEMLQRVQVLQVRLIQAVAEAAAVHNQAQVWAALAAQVM
jgi:hypothetical protein